MSWTTWTLPIVKPHAGHLSALFSAEPQHLYVSSISWVPCFGSVWTGSLTNAGCPSRECEWNSFLFLTQISWPCPQTWRQQQPCTEDLSTPCMMSQTRFQWPTLQFSIHCLTWKSKCTTPRVQSLPKMTSLSLHPSCLPRWHNPCWRTRLSTWRIRVLPGKQIHLVQHLVPSTPSGVISSSPAQVITVVYMAKTQPETVLLVPSLSCFH